MSVRAARPGALETAGVPPPATRDVILDASERLFSAHGVDGVAVRDLARELGLTASSLYNHFPGKQALYEAVLERGLRPIVEIVQGAWQAGQLRRDMVAVTDPGWWSTWRSTRTSGACCSGRCSRRPTPCRR